MMIPNFYQFLLFFWDGLKHVETTNQRCFFVDIPATLYDFTQFLMIISYTTPMFETFWNLSRMGSVWEWGSHAYDLMVSTMF